MAARPSLFYHRAALTHVAQLAVLSLSIATLLVTFSVVLAAIALVLAEALLVAIAPRFGPFRSSIDRTLARAAREAAAVAHAALLGDMRESHASELTHLERLAADVNASWRGDASEVVVERALGIETFLATYARLAVAYRRSADAFAMEGWAALEAEAARLANLPLAGADEWLDRRRAVVEMRRAAWIRASRDRDVMLHALATIGEMVRFVHDLSVTTVDDPARAEVDDVLARYADALSRVRRLEADVPAAAAQAF